MDIQCMYTLSYINYATQKTFTLRIGFKSSERNMKHKKQNEEVKKKKKERERERDREGDTEGDGENNSQMMRK